MCKLHSKPKLFNVLGFNGTFDSSDGYYRLKIPQVILSTNQTSYITYVQPVSTKYRLTDIAQIQIRSNSLPVNGEYDSASSQNIIMSLDYTTTTIKDILEFSTTLNNRFYDLNNSGSISTINFSIFVVYNTGVVEIARLPPYSKFTLLCQFVKKNL